MNVSVFPTAPKFQLGQGVIHCYDADFMKDGVVPAKDFGVVVGIIYCDEESIYPGWSYQVYLWKTVYQYHNRTEVEYYSDITYSSFDESEHVEATHIVDCAKLVKRIGKKQIKKYNNYNNETNKNTKLYHLLNEILVKDTYYDDLIETTSEEIDK